MTDLLLLHGLTYDHHTWDLLRPHLDPERKVLAVDLPGHGRSAQRPEYPLEEVLEDIHQQVTDAGLTAPVVVGHSLGAIVATTYAAQFPATAVVNVDQPLLMGRFGDVVRQAEPLLRSPQWRQFWNRMLANMGIEALPDQARTIVQTSTDPRQDLLLGYWNDILRYTDEEIKEQRSQELRTIGERSVAYHWISSFPPAQDQLEWLTSILPVEVTVLPGGHFPHLSHPADVARALPA
ncbi:alpha/beta fold hydrolase [Kineosporia babensis]|uniref:Alpha/beta hydrolase n=1 Tax=Kineosporia babensis TaxID=499548 RepID=A0A9X1NC31_9ACTN|nr:alpha/beta hydrolase [Kineosporia babensis]